MPYGFKGWMIGCWLTVGSAALAPAVSATAEDAVGTQGIRVTFDAGGAPVTMTRDAAGTIQFDGLPYPGLVLYRPSTGVVYYQHPSEPLWLTVQPGQGQGVSATVAAGPAWQPWQGHPTQRWDIKGGLDKAAPSCGQWYGSADAAQQAGVSMADMIRVLAVLEWLNAGSKGPVCQRLAITPAEGARIGLPVYWMTLSGPWQLTEVVRAGVAPIALPDAVKPVDDSVRLQILLSQFAPEERQAFVRANGTLPVARQVEAIEGALSEMVMP